MIAEIFLPIVFVARVFLFDSYHAPSDSMSPTIKRGDAFFTSKVHSGHYGLVGVEVLNLALGGSYKPGDIIVFQYPPDRNLTFVKRIIASGGDTVEYSDHTLTINGTTITTEAVSEESTHQAGVP